MSNITFLYNDLLLYVLFLQFTMMGKIIYSLLHIKIGEEIDYIEQKHIHVEMHVRRFHQEELKRQRDRARIQNKKMCKAL